MSRNSGQGQAGGDGREDPDGFGTTQFGFLDPDAERVTTLVSGAC